MTNIFKKLKRQLYNWGFYIIAIIGAVLDLGFDVIRPELVEIGLNPKFIFAIRFIMIVGTVVRAKLALPSQNKDKLEEIIDKRL
jgi:hypothetical protein